MRSNQNHSNATDQELLEALIPQIAVKELVAEYGEVRRALLNSFPEELRNLKGIGPMKARQLGYLCALAKRLYQASEKLPDIIKCPQDVANQMIDMHYLNQEEFRIVLLNTKNHIIAIRTLTVGTTNTSLISPILIFNRAVKMMAASIILVHNHPSGDPMPSPEDIALTKRMVEAGILMDIPVVDHVIIGMGKHISLKERGLI